VVPSLPDAVIDRIIQKGIALMNQPIRYAIIDRAPLLKCCGYREWEPMSISYDIVFPV
jgi:hypothetical protein